MLYSGKHATHTCVVNGQITAHTAGMATISACMIRRPRESTFRLKTIRISHFHDDINCQSHAHYNTTDAHLNKRVLILHTAYESSACACAQRTGAAGGDSLWRGRPGGLKSPAIHACGSASPFCASYAVTVTIIGRKIMPADIKCQLHAYNGDAHLNALRTTAPTASSSTRTPNLTVVAITVSPLACENI